MTSPPRTLHGPFEQQAVVQPDALAAKDGGTELTFGQLEDLAGRFARFLVDRGLVPGGRVGVCLPHATGLAVALLATLKAGGVCVPLDPEHPPERLAWMLADSAASLLVVDAHTAGLLPAAGMAVVRVDDRSWRSSEPYQGRGPSAPSDAAYVVYTSGSTGVPKGVLLSHAGLSNHSEAVIGIYGLVPDDVTLQMSSIGFDISIEEMFPTWGAGGCVAFRPVGAPLSGAAFVEDLLRLGVSVLDLPTAFWHQWVRELELLGLEVPRCLRAVIVGGEKADAGVLARWVDAGGARVRWFNTYGPTEASVIATAWEVPDDWRARPGEDLPLGRPLPGVSLRVLDAEGVAVPPGTVGELSIGGIGVALGYLNRPDAEAERFVRDGVDRWYGTGDRVSMGADGMLRFRGRIDDQVKIRGFRVEPGEVEAALASDPSVAQAAVVARPGPQGEQRLLAYVVSAAGQDADGGEILRLLPERLPLHLVPASITVLPSLPLNANGKVDRRALPDVDSVERRIDGPIEGPRDGLDRALIDLWLDVLGVDQVGITDDFFALGGHSLSAIRLLGTMEWLMGASVPLAVLLEQPTIEHLADVIRGGLVPASDSLVQPVRATGDRPPLLYICTVETGVVALRHVLPFLPEDQPVYAYVLRRAQSSGPASVEDLAALGLDALRNEVPASSYSLLGYTIGGLVAYEMAGRLRADGSDVQLLALLDTWAPGDPTSAAAGANALRRAARIARSSCSSRGRRALASALRRRLRVRHPHAPKVPGSAPLLIDDGALTAVYDAYRPRPYDGMVLLLATSVTRHGGDQWLGWDVSSGRWDRVTVPGEHGNLMRADHAPAVGSALAAALRAGRTAT